MNKIRFLSFVVVIGTLLLSACGAAASTATPAPVSATQNVDVIPVSFVGIVDSMAGDQWVISGTTVTVDPSIVRDGPFKVGDYIKVEGFTSPDGSFKVSRVETPSGQDILTATPSVEDNSNDVNANINDDNSNSLNSNDDNGNTVNSNDSNINDDNSNLSNSSDDNNNTANTNDDKGGGSNSNDDNGGGSGGGNSNDGNGNGG